MGLRSAVWRPSLEDSLQSACPAVALPATDIAKSTGSGPRGRPEPPGLLAMVLGAIQADPAQFCNQLTIRWEWRKEKPQMPGQHSVPTVCWPRDAEENGLGIKQEAVALFAVYLPTSSAISKLSAGLNLSQKLYLCS